MKVKEIFSKIETKIFIVTDPSPDDELNWIVEPTEFELLPADEENIYFVKAIQVSIDKIVDCYLSIITPERIVGTVFKRDSDGQIIKEDFSDQKESVIPAVASECFGDYELYYLKDNPQVGIDVLRIGLDKATNKNIVAEDLGYLLRDEKRIEEAIEAFKISEQFGPSSVYVFLELSRLYKRLGDLKNQLAYEQKFQNEG